MVETSFEPDLVWFHPKSVLLTYPSGRTWDEEEFWKPDVKVMNKVGGVMGKLGDDSFDGNWNTVRQAGKKMYYEKVEEQWLAKDIEERQSRKWLQPNIG